MLRVQRVGVHDDFFSLGGVSVSPDGHLLAYSTDTVGHVFAPFAPPRQAGVSSEDYERYSAVPEKFFRARQKPASIMAGMDTVFTISTFFETGLEAETQQGINVAEAVKAAGVKHVVYTSAPRATTSALILAPEHKATEEYLAASGLPYTVLRNNWYTENYVPALEQARATGVVLTSAGAGRVASAPRADYAAAASVVLRTEGHEGAVYELGGDEPWTFAELAEAIATVLGRDVVVQQVGTDEHLAALRAAGLDEGTAGFLVAMDADIRAGLLAGGGLDLSRLIGRPTTPLVPALRAAAGLG